MGTVSILVGIISALLMLGILWVILIVLSWILIPRVVEVISETTKVISGIDAVIGAIIEGTAEASKLNHIAHVKIIDLIHEVVRAQKVERINISNLIEILDEVKQELDKNGEKLDENQKELNSLEEELSKVVKIPKWMQKLSK